MTAVGLLPFTRAALEVATAVLPPYRSQALERAQGWIRLPDGKARTGFGPCCTRHGMTTLFAALNVPTGEKALRGTSAPPLPNRSAKPLTTLLLLIIRRQLRWSERKRWCPPRRLYGAD